MTKQQKNAPVSALFYSVSAKERENAPVAVMDSGAGGIGVLREIAALLPCEELIYFGDSAHAPYGDRAPEEVKALVLEHAARLLMRAKALVLACNTATSLAVGELRRRYPGVPIVGMEPALRPALAVGEHPRILVLATPITLRERKFAALLKGCAGDATVIPIAAPVLVRLVESGRADSPEAEEYLRELLAPYLHPTPDALVLGCTHFPLAKNAINRATGWEIPMFDGALGTAKQLARRLAAAELLNKTPARGTITLTSSDSAALPLYAKLLFGDA